MNNWSGLSQNVSSYWPNYDMHLNMESKMTVGKHLVDIDLDANLCHSYDAVSSCSLTQEEAFSPASKNNSLQISEGLLNSYLASAYKNSAFKISVNSKAMSMWKKWLNLDVADLDVGFMKAMVPEMDSDLDDNTLVDLELSAHEVPVLSFKDNTAHLSLRLAAAFSYKKSLLGKVLVDGVFSSKLAFNSATSSLDLTNLEVDFTSLSILDDEQKVIQSGKALALSALAQLAQPALTQMANLKGLNLNNFLPSLDYVTPSIQDVLLENGQMTVLLKMDMKSFEWSTL